LAAPAPASPGRADLDRLLNDVADQPRAAAPLTPTEGWEPEFLKSLPHPPDEPYSMLAPPPPPGPPPPNLERYFELDPLLDPPYWQQPGWFSNVQIGVVHPQLFFGMVRHGVLFENRYRIIAPGAARFGWAIAPRIELGYRLPSGFGAFSISDRFFTTYGTGTVNGLAGSATRNSRIGVNYWDYDYSNREFTPWQNWTMEWRVGVRTAFSWIGNVVDQPFSRAAMGHGIFISGDSNYTVGNGPHFGVALERKSPKTGLSFLTKIDLADEFTRVRQLFGASFTTLNAAGMPSRAFYTQNFWNQTPILNFQVGLGWQPPNNPNIQLYIAYVYEFWWQIASNMNLIDPFTFGGTRGAMNNQGLIFQGQVKF